MTLARSVDGGKTFMNYAWSDEPFGGDDVFLGDYEWMAAYGGDAFGIWAEAAPEGYQVTAPPPRSSTPSPTPRMPTIIRLGTADFTGK